MTRKIGLAALTVLELSPPEQISVAAQAGYDFVGLRLIPVSGQPHQHAVDLPAIQQRLAATGMKVLDVEVFRLDAGTDVADYEPMLALAARLGASDLLVHGADPDRSRLADNWGRLCELAERYGLAANMEPMPWVEISTIAKANRILELAPRDNAAVLPDAIHFFREANSFEELATTKTRYLQFCDARAKRPGCSPRCRPSCRSPWRFPTRGRCRRWNARGWRWSRQARCSRVRIRWHGRYGASLPAIAPMAARPC
jgi:sugar phosphate isomerase/epimerase